MNDQTEIQTGTALALPEPTDLAALFKKEDGIAAIVSKLENAAREEAKLLDASTKAGRKGLISLAAKVSSSKAELDRQGKALTEQQRKEIAAVNAGRNLAEERLAALRDEIRAPVTAWELAEAARIDALKDRLSALDGGRADHLSPSETIKAVLAEIQATELGDDWEEYLPLAAIAKDKAITQLTANLAAAQHREAEQAELARLRAEAAAREEAERQRKEAEEAEARRIAAEKAEAERLARIEQEKQEAARRAAQEAEERAAAAAERVRIEAEQRAEAARKAAADREAAMERAAREAEERHARELAEAKAREQAAAQAERDRIEAQRRAEDEARKKREADQAHRARIRNEIAAALKTLDAGNWFTLADALIDGRVPHVRVEL